MKKVKSLFTILLLSPVLLFAQVKFERVYGSAGYDFGYSVTQMYDTGYAVAGSSSSFGSGNTDLYLLKTNKLGVAVGQKTFGGINIDQGYSIKSTADSGLVIAGYTNSFGHGGYDMYVIKTDKNCDSIWTRTYGGADWDFAYSVEPTADGGYVVAGGTFSFGAGNEDMYLIKLDQNGDTVWTKTYGGVNDDEARCVRQTSDGGYILTGTSKSIGDAVNGDIYTVRTDSMGDTLWTFRFQGGAVDYSYEVLEDNAGGGFIIAGEVYTALQGMQGIVVRINPGGSFITATYYGGPTTANDGTHSIAQASDGRFVNTGYTYSYGAGASDMVFYLEDPIGTYVGSMTFGGAKVDKGYCIRNTFDGGFIICGTTLSYSTFERILLIKTDSLGAAVGSVTSAVTGINTPQNGNGSSELFLYPNPANELIFVQLDSKHVSENTFLTITDVLGRTVFSRVIESGASNNLIEVSVADFQPGVYLVNVHSESHSSKQKLVIQK